MFKVKTQHKNVGREQCHTILLSTGLGICGDQLTLNVPYAGRSSEGFICLYNITSLFKVSKLSCTI